MALDGPDGLEGIGKEIGGLVHVLGPTLDWAASIVDVLAIFALLVGVARFLRRFAIAELTSRSARQRHRRLRNARFGLAEYILLGLELFVVADVIHTALTLQLTDLAFLAALVAVRFLVAYFVDRERRGLAADPAH